MIAVVIIRYDNKYVITINYDIYYSMLDKSLYRLGCVGRQKKDQERVGEAEIIRHVIIVC